MRLIIIFLALLAFVSMVLAAGEQMIKSQYQGKAQIEKALND